ncbi:MAG: hypothetical protein V1647_03570 [Pseudomonadota bacterium]
MRCYLLVLLAVFLKASICSAACTAAVITATLTFVKADAGTPGSSTIATTDPGAGIARATNTIGKSVKPSVALNNPATICNAGTCITVSAPTVSPSVATMPDGNGYVFAYVGGKVTWLAGSPSGVYTGTPIKVTFACTN